MFWRLYIVFLFIFFSINFSINSNVSFAHSITLHSVKNREIANKEVEKNKGVIKSKKKSDYIVWKKYHTDDTFILTNDLNIRKGVCHSDGSCTIKDGDDSDSIIEESDNNIRKEAASNNSLQNTQEKTVYFQKVPSFHSLHDWAYDDHRTALNAFLHSCVAIYRRKNTLPISSTTNIGGTVYQWKQVCSVAYKVYKNKLDARVFFETYFQPYRVTYKDGKKWKFTGYYEIEIDGSLKKTDKYKYPVYGVPADINELRNTGELTHAIINRGALRNRNLEIAWVKDKMLLYTMQLQGSGVIRLENGKRIRLGYAGNNGLSYRSVHQYWQDSNINFGYRNDIPSFPLAGDKTVLKVLEKNPSYVFFNIRSTPYVTGVSKVPLTSQRSVAIDNKVYPYGTLFWIDTPFSYHLVKVKGGKNSYVYGKGRKAEYRRLMVGQDRGGAIKGAMRLDIFFGSGKDAGILSHHMNDMGAAYVLFPNFISIPAEYRHK